MRKIILLLTFYLLFTSILAEDDENKVEQVEVGIKRTFRLTGTPPFVGHYVLSVKNQSLPKDQDKWYLFAMAQPKQSSTEVFGSPSKIQISKVDGSGTITKIKECGIVEDSDSCFIKNKHFDYKTDKIRVSVHCQKQCEYQFITQVDQAYPLQMNKVFKLDFQDTAYSKIFTLNTEGQQFYQLRITLQPKGFIKYGEPVILLANFGNKVPSRDKYDLKGIHTWDDGQGIFIRKSDMKERTLTLLVEGPEKNVLNLQASGWQKQQKVKLIQYWPQFDYLKAGQFRQFILPIEANLTHRVKVVTFSGAVALDKVQKVSQQGGANTPLNYSMPNLKYGQFQFRISKQMIQKQKITKISVRIQAIKQSTYILNFAREELSISTLLPFISQSSIMEVGQIDQYFIKVQELIQQTKQKKSSNIQVIVGNINGNLKLKFYKCNVAHKTGTDNAKNCQLTASNKQDFTEALASKIQNRGSQERHYFTIQWLDYVKKSDKGGTQIVYQLVVVIQNMKNNTQSSYQIQYKNKDRIYLLKEGQLVKDRVFINQKRHYKLSLLDNDATQIRIHCTRISGDAIFTGSLEDPRVNKEFTKILPEYSVITFKIPPNQVQTQVFVQVKGIDMSYYSLTSQVIRKSQSSPTKKNSTGYNQLIVRQQIPYQFIIGPKDSIVMQLHATQTTFRMNLKSSSSVQVCMTENLMSPPFAPNCEIRNDNFLQMSELLNMDRGLVGNVGIKNNNDFNVTVKLLINPVNKQFGNKTQTCELAIMNEVMFKLLDQNGKDVQGETYHCIEYNLNKNAQVQLIIELNKQYQYNQGKITANINGQQKIQILSPTHIFTKEEVQMACKADRKHGDPQNFCYLKVKFSGLKNTKIRVMAQYTDKAIRLMDGVAHSVHGAIKKIQSRQFYFAIHNYENVTVILQNKVGEYKIFANIMKYSEFAEQSEKNNTQIYPTLSKNDFQSANPFYYLEQIINIPKQKITEKCKHDTDTGSLLGKKWVDCVILISVTLQGEQQIQKNGKFVIEATQKNRQLKQNVATSGYLQKKSVAFYHYQNQVANGTLIINVNNQNKLCLDIYVKEGTQRASSSSYDKHAKASNTIILNKTIISTYSVTLQANDNCPYTIQVSTAKNNIGKIKKGTFTDINLKLNEEKNFLFENLINETFKILTLHKNGQVIISVKPIPREKVKQVVNSSVSSIRDWAWSNKDSVRVSNFDNRNNQLVVNPNYCVDCYYLINIKAQRDTQASVLIPTPGTELPITTDSQIRDLLQKNQSDVFRIFTQSKSQFELYVQYGKVKVSIVESTNKDVIIFNKTFQASKAPVIQPFSLSESKQTYQFLRYSRITITAEQESFFSFAIISNLDPSKRSQGGLKYGIPQYIYIQQNKQKCVIGFMTASIDQFLFSFSKNDLKTVQKLQTVVRINEKIVTTERQLGNNQMILKVTSEVGKQADANKKFHLCMKSAQAVSVTVIQSSPLSYWPQKQSIVVKKQSNLTFGAEGKTIIEINQCKSRASAQVFSQFNQMKSTSSVIKQRRRSNNIVEFYGYGAVYIKIKAEKATFRWISVNEAENRGLGYEDFKSSWIRVLKQGNKIEVTADPIKYVDEKQAKSKLTVVAYSFFAAKQQMQMYNSMNCGQGEFISKQQIVNLTSNALAGKDLVKAQFSIQNDLLPKFQKYSYFLVGVKAQVTSTLPNGQTENYRFFYPYQQISKEMLSSGGNGQIGPYVPQENDNGSILQTIGYILVLLIVLVAAYHIYNKVVKRCRNKKQKVNDSMGRQMKYFDLTEN